MSLSKQQLADRVGVLPELIDELVRHDLLDEVDDDRFDIGAVHVARLMVALDASGIDLGVLARARREEAISPTFYPEWFPPESSAPGTSFGEFLESNDVDSKEVARLYRGLGLAEPDSRTQIDDEEQRIVSELLSVISSLGDQSILRRVLATYASAAAQSAERGLALYGERFRELSADPIRDAVEGFDPRLEPWSRLSRMGPPLIAWLYRRHLERAIDSFSVLNTERYLAEFGYISPRKTELESIVFVDIAGYTSMVEREGDMLSALLGTGVGDYTSAIARRRGGKLIKLLGDGAMLYFPTVESAVEAAVEIMQRSTAADVPPLHIGVACGPMIYRDGDYYGHTVNMAARLSGAAPTGEIYVTADVASAVNEHGISPLGPMSLKGIAEPVDVFALA